MIDFNTSNQIKNTTLISRLEIDMSYSCKNLVIITNKVVLLYIEWYINTYVYQQRLNVRSKLL